MMESIFILIGIIVVFLLLPFFAAYSLHFFDITMERLERKKEHKKIKKQVKQLNDLMFKKIKKERK